MANPVMAYKSWDGDLHASKEAAEWRDRQIKKAHNEGKLAELVEPYLRKQHFSALTKSIAPFNQNHYYNDDNHYERERFANEVAQFILESWNDIAKVVFAIKRHEKDEKLYGR